MALKNQVIKYMIKFIKTKWDGNKVILSNFRKIRTV